MPNKLILTTIASASILFAAQALAHPGGGGPGGGAGGPPTGAGPMGNGGGWGPGGSGGMGNAAGTNDARDDARVNSQGPDNASATGISHANGNSVLAGTTASSRIKGGPLAGVTTGMSVMSNGRVVGTVLQIRMAGNGAVALVLVKGTDGGIFPVPANKLTLSGTMLTTTARFGGINDSRTEARLNSQGPLHASATGIAHANQHSVLNGASTAPVTGISVGMPVYSNAIQVGSVVRVVTANGIIRRVLVQGTNGRIFSLSPRSLTSSGGSIMTTASLRGL